jgi:RNase H-fold protein (predicted Holliday junction resolvase)
VVPSLADGGAERVVVGLPLSFGGADSVQTREVRAFADRPRGGVTVPVELYESSSRRSWRRLMATAGSARIHARQRTC